MSQQIINISNPDDGLGDALRNGFDKTNQNFTELYNGKVDKITGKGLSENDFTNSDKAKLNGIEAGAQVNVQADAAETDPLSPSYIQNFPPSLYSAVGHFYYADLATQTTPLAAVANVPTKITNDTLGTNTELGFAPYAVPNVWDDIQNSFVFSNLDLGDSARLRLDLAITTTATNQTIQLYLKFGVDTASEYDLLIDSWNEKSTVAFKHFLKTIDFSIDNQDWKSAPAELFILSDANASVKVNGFYVPIVRKSVNIVNFTGGADFLKKDIATYTPATLPLSNSDKLLINQSGVFKEVAKSEFNNIIEGYFNGTNFYTDALFTNLITPESSKIYINLAVTPATQYRWSGSAYVQIGGGSNTFVFSQRNSRLSATLTAGNWHGFTNNAIFSISNFPTNYGATILAITDGNLRGMNGFIVDGINIKKLNHVIISQQNVENNIDFEIEIWKYDFQQNVNSATALNLRKVIAFHQIGSSNYLTGKIDKVVSTDAIDTPASHFSKYIIFLKTNGGTTFIHPAIDWNFQT